MPTAHVNGYDLFYAEDEFTDPGRAPEPVFMQHFVWGSHVQFNRWVPTLARHYRVIRMDRRGNGYSSAPPLDYRYNLEDLLSDFDGFLDALHLEKVHYVGVSLGGVLGAAYAATRPERVKSLVLCSTPCWIKSGATTGWSREGYPDGIAAVKAMGSKAWALTGWTRSMPANPPAEDLMKAVTLSEQTGLMKPHAIASLQQMVGQRDFDITSMLPQIQAPTLLLSPGNSHTTSLEEQAMMKETIPNCEQVVFEGALHFIANEQPDRCSREALEFIKRHSG